MNIKRLLKKVPLFRTSKHRPAKRQRTESHFGQGVKRTVSTLLLLLFCSGVLAFSVRGLPGNPTQKSMNTSLWKENGPLELSPERGRFALLYALAENRTAQFSVDLARFAAPDVGYINGRYVSLFAPAVSFIVIPGYLVGKYFGASQVGAFAVVAFFALINFYLIAAIAQRLGAHPIAATIGAFAFLFASPAYAYAVTLYQHHISTFLILMSVYLLIRFRSALSLALIWMLCALSLSVDYPNFFLMLPIGIYALARTLPVSWSSEKVSIQFPILKLLAVIALAFPLAYFFWFNKFSYGNPLQLAGTVERSVGVKADGQPILESEVIKARQKAQEPRVQPKPQQQKSAIGFFKNRNLLNGFYIHFFSPDRGILMYTPVMLFGIVGMFLAYKKKGSYLGLFIAIIGFDVLLYSLWDDPYGGWAFGSRYLIPAYALSSIYISLALTYLKRYNLFLLVFFGMLIYSIGVNTLGAVTSNSNPPQVEAEALSRSIHAEVDYTYLANMHLLDVGSLKSFIFQALAKHYMSAWSYYAYLTILITLVGAFLIIAFKISAAPEAAAIQMRKSKTLSRRLAQSTSKIYAV